MRGLLVAPLALALVCAAACCVECAEKSPLWAALGSAVIPGGGQFYCEEYLRGVAFCCAQTTLAAMTLYEHTLTEQARRRYLESTDPDDYAAYAHHFDRRNNLFWWDAGVWALAAADAFVDAHMYRFGGEASLELGPVGRNGVGIHVAFGF